jgi:hypothetical protein
MITLLNIPLPTAIAGNAEEAYVMVPFDARVISAHVVPNTTAALNGTNYAIVGLATNDGAGGSFTAIATPVTTETVAFTVGVDRPMTVTNPNISAGQVVRVAKTIAGSGAVADVNVVLELEKLF